MQKLEGISEKIPLFLCPPHVSIGKCESAPSLLGASLSERALFAAVSFTFLRELFANWALIATFAVKISGTMSHRPLCSERDRRSAVKIRRRQYVSSRQVRKARTGFEVLPKK